MLKCPGNPLDDLPALPSTLQELDCELPRHEDQIYDGPIVFKGMDPNWVGWIDHVLRQSMLKMNQESKQRCVTRCAAYKEEIMMTVWHPRRVEKLIEMGIDLEDVM
jgi:hypothetical protein